jgi:hypothetical protein
MKKPLGKEVGMSFVENIVPVFTRWALREAAIGLGTDVINNLSKPYSEISFRNTAVHLAASVAITAIAVAFGSPAALGAFLAHTIFVINSHMQGCTEKAEKPEYHVMMLLFGAVVGALF